MKFKTLHGLLNHIGAHAAALKIDRKQKSYECQRCSTAYVMRILLDCHKMAHILGHDIDDTPIDKQIESLIIIKPDQTHRSQDDGNVIAPKTSVPNILKSSADSVHPIAASTSTSTSAPASSANNAFHKLDEHFESPVIIKPVLTRQSQNDGNIVVRKTSIPNILKSSAGSVQPIVAATPPPASSANNAFHKRE